MGGSVAMYYYSYISISSSYTLFRHWWKRTFAALFLFPDIITKRWFCIHQSYWIFLIGIVVVTLGESFWQATLLKFDSWQVIPYYISAIAGLLAVFYLSGTINSRKIYSVNA